MSPPLLPHIKYHDNSRRCTRCGMVVMPQAAYCSTCGTAQSLAYTPWQVFGQLFQLWFAVVLVIYVGSLVWRFALPAVWTYVVQCVVSGEVSAVRPAGVQVMWFVVDVCIGPHGMLRQSDVVPAWVAVPLADFYEYVLLNTVITVAQMIVHVEQLVIQWVTMTWTSAQGWWCTTTSGRLLCP